MSKTKKQSVRRYKCFGELECRMTTVDMAYDALMRELLAMQALTEEVWYRKIKMPEHQNRYLGEVWIEAKRFADSLRKARKRFGTIPSRFEEVFYPEVIERRAKRAKRQQA